MPNHPNPSDLSDTPLLQGGELMERISALLSDLAQAAPGPVPGRQSTDEAIFENRLAMVRLGMATALFNALRAKHPPTAAHSLRVALGCSAWATQRNMPEADRDRLEVAALLHDIGKIGVPDRLLKKPGKLSGEERMTVDLQSALGCEILRGCCADEPLLDIIRYRHTWFDGRRQEDAGVSADLPPVGARMLAIVEAFDAMTTDQVFRRAHSRERALDELAECAGTQFDPELVEEYRALLRNRPEVMHGAVARRWLHELRPSMADRFWTGSGRAPSALPAVPPHSPAVDPLLFYRHQVDTSPDGVVMVDREGLVIGWSSALEEQTGISAQAILGNRFVPDVIGLRDRDGNSVPEDACPVADCLHSPANATLTVGIRTIDGPTEPRELILAPVFGHEASLLGAVATFRVGGWAPGRASGAPSVDPLTRLPDRSALMQALAVATADSSRPTCALLLADLDRLRLVNARHGTKTGDRAVRQLAEVLRTVCRDRDVLSRLSGDQIAVLCPACELDTAVARAEKARQMIAGLGADSGLAGLSASFGVTVLLPGDKPQTCLTRVNRALLHAKEGGRNRVERVGGEAPAVSPPASRRGRGLFAWFTGPGGVTELDVRLVTPTPLDLTVEKIRGFVLDHDAAVVSTRNDLLEITLDFRHAAAGRRRTDRRTQFQLQLRLSERSAGSTLAASEPRRVALTIIELHIEPARMRDRRNRGLQDACEQLAQAVRGYLAAEFDDRD